MIESCIRNHFAEKAGNTKTTTLSDRRKSRIWPSRRLPILEQRNDACGVLPAGNNHVGMGMDFELQNCAYQPMPIQPYMHTRDMDEGGIWV